MEKLKINNQVVLMRKHVKQAKVRVINKLVKQVKLLQNRKGSEAQMAKAKRKADRFLEEIVLLKKIKPDYVSKLALTKARDWRNILKQKNSMLDDRCIAMLTTYEAVQKAVENFHNLNPNLISKIPEFIKEWEEKNKLSKNSPKGSKDLNIIKAKEKNKTQANAPKVEIDLNKKSDIREIQQNKDLISCNEENKLLYENVDRNKIAVYNCQEMKKEVSLMQKVQQDLNLAALQEDNSEGLPCMAVEYKDISHVGNPYPEDDSLIDNVETEESDSDFEQNSINSANSEYMQHDFKNTLDTKALDNYTKDSNRERSNIQIEDKNVKSCVKTTEKDSSTNENSLEKQISDTIPVSNEYSKSFLNSQIILDKNQLLDSVQCNKVLENQKTITVLNLDELQGLDEIPVNKSFESEEDDQNDSEKTDHAPDTSDPFFLRGNEMDSHQANKSDYSRNNLNSKMHPANVPFMSIGDNHHIRKFRNDHMPYCQSEFKKQFGKSSRSVSSRSNNYIEIHSDNLPFRSADDKPHKREFRSNHMPYQSKFERKFEKSSDNSHYSSSFKSKSERNLNFKKDRFHLKNYQDGPQTESKRSHRDAFHLKNKTVQTCRKDSSDSYPDKLKSRSGTNFVRENKVSVLKNNTNDKPLHPSWEAKRKQKELIKTPFQGKRVVFDD